MMASRSSLLRKLDKCLWVAQRPGDADPQAAVEGRYGDRVDEPSTTATAPDLVQCWGAYEPVPQGGSEPTDEGGRNVSTTRWILALDPQADVSAVKTIREYADPTDTTSALVREFHVKSVHLVSSFRGRDSHWEIAAETID